MAALVQAMEDALSTNRKPSYQKAREEAREWFEGAAEGSDLATLCDLIGVPPRQVKDLYLAVLAGSARRQTFHWLRNNRIPEAGCDDGEGVRHG